MNKRGTMQLLSERLEQLQRLIKTADKRLGELEKFNLVTRKSKNTVQYYSKREGTSEPEKYISKKNEDLIRSLEERNYYKILRKKTEIESNVLAKTLKELERTSEPEAVFFEIPEEKRHLIEPCYAEMSQKSINDWKSKEGFKKGGTQDSTFITRSGVYVRSKSELIIADRLDFMNIPYKYEYPLLIEATYYFPDFLVLNKKTGKEYYWEHFGMMDNPQYCAGAQSRIEKYAEYGIIPGKNLIISTESSMHPLKTRYVDLLINTFLL